MAIGRKKTVTGNALGRVVGRARAPRRAMG